MKTPEDSIAKNKNTMKPGKSSEVAAKGRFENVTFAGPTVVLDVSR